MREFDVYLDGLGYMLVKDQAGKLLQGASQVTKTDPFTRYVSEEDRWKRRSFQFDQGAGALKDDGAKRYAYGYDVDSRGGYMKRGARPHSTRGSVLAGNAVVDPDSLGADVGDYLVAPGVVPLQDRYAYQVVFAAPRTVRTIRVLVKRDPEEDYTNTADFQVELWTDTGGNVPNAVIAGCTASMSLVATPLHWLPHENLWLEHRYFWLECHFAASVVVGAGTYWVVVRNEAVGNEVLYWGHHPEGAARIAYYTGAMWVVEDDGLVPFASVLDRGTIDASCRVLAVFRGDAAGADSTRRVYAGVGCHVLFWNDATGPGFDGEWVWLREFANPVLDMLDFNNKLFVATGPAVVGPPQGGLHYYDGDHVTTPGPPPGLWTHVIQTEPGTPRAAWSLALHDNIIWKSGPPYGAELQGSTVGLTGNFWSTPVNIVGDPRTTISKMVSHGGKLYCVKPEGIFEVTYPDGYPAGTGGQAATSNMVHDFRTDRTGRNFVLDWHSALYFPGTGGIFEWKSGILRDMWRERFTPDEAAAPAWPVYDAQKGYFRMATATTRGLVFGSYSPFVPTTPGWYDAVNYPEEPQDIGQIWFYDGQWLHPLMAELLKGEPIYAAILEDRGEGFGWLWYGVGLDIKYVEWPNWTQDRAGDERSEFWDVGRCYWVMPQFDDDRPDIQKDWHELRVRTTALGSVTAAGEAGEVLFFMALDDGPMAYMGTANESPMQAVQFPAGSVSYKLQLGALLDPELSDETVTQKIYAIDVLYQPLPETITQHQVWIRLVKGQMRHRAAPDQRGAAVQWTELSALLELLEPFVYEDALGISHCVRAAGATRSEITQSEQPSDEGTGILVEGAVLVTMLEVSEKCPES